jgi:phenylacetate-CoA ligase
MDQSELDTLLRNTIQHAYAHAPAVQAIFDQAGLAPADIQSTADLDKIPVTSKDRLIQLQQENPPFGGFLAVPPETLQHVFFSPGPLYIPWTGEVAAYGTAQTVRQIGQMGRDDVVINTITYHLVPVGLSLDALFRQVGATIIPAGVGAPDLQVKMMHDLRATFYLGTPSWLYALIQKAEELGYNFRRDFALHTALTTAEPLPPSLRQTLVEQYGLRVVNSYGTAELGVLAYDVDGNMAMRLFDAPIVQIVHPETGQSVPPGETGQVVVTSFNTTFPLIRFGTGDLAINVDPAPGQSRQADRSIILVGRVGEAVKVRGMFVHPNQLRFALGRVPGIARAQGIVTRQENRDEFTLRVLLQPNTTPSESLSNSLHEAIRSSCRVKVDHVEFVDEETLPEGGRFILDQRTWQ